MAHNISVQYFGRDLEAMSFARNYHRWILGELEPYLGNIVAEVGAGTGSFSKLILGTSVKRLYTFEPSRNMYPFLEQNLQQDKRAITINDFFDHTYMKEGFDSVAYVNVLEHIEDDLAELANAREALKPNGHLLLFVPAMKWLYGGLDKQVGHFRRYTKEGLVALVRSAGFSIVKVRYFDVAGIIPWYVNFVLLKNAMGSGSVSMYDKLVVPGMRKLERLLPPPVGKNVLLVGRKT